MTTTSNEQKHGGYSHSEQWTIMGPPGELAVDVGVTLVLSFSGLATLLLGRLA